MTTEPGGRGPISAPAAEAAFAAVWVILGIAVVLASQDMREPAGRFPTLAGGLLAFVAAVRIARLARGATFAFPAIERPNAVRAIGLFVGLWGLWLMTLALGLVIAGLVWTFAILVGLYRWSMRRSAFYAVAFMLAIATLFPALGLHLPGGFLFPR
jgi:hypothetical protein